MHSSRLRLRCNSCRGDGDLGKLVGFIGPRFLRFNGLGEWI